VYDKFAAYGKIRYVKCVRAHFAMEGSERHNGSAFVQFISTENAQKVIDLATNSDSNKPSFLIQNEGIRLGGRQLNITLAVDRNEASKLRTTDKKEKIDKKNAYLAREGLIAADSDVSASMSTEDKDKRMRAYQEKKKKLKNPNYTISKFRLSIRNIPQDWDEKLVKACALKHTQTKLEEQGGKFDAPVVSQVKIIRDKIRTDKEGKPKSKGFGFVEFNDHESALACLRALNNNPFVFTKNQRPVVEFAVDDQRKLHARNKRLERNSKRQEQREEQRALQLAEAKEHEAADVEQEQQMVQGNISDSAEQTTKPDKKRKRKKKQDSEVGDSEINASNLNGSESAQPLTKKQKRKLRKNERQVNRLLGLPIEKKELKEASEDDTKEKNSKQKKNKKDVQSAKEINNTEHTESVQTTTDKKKKRKGVQLTKREKKDVKEDEQFQKLVNNYKKKFFAVDNEKSQEIKKRWYE